MIQNIFTIKLDGATGDEIWTVQGEPSVSGDLLWVLDVDFAGDLVAAGVTGDVDEMDILEVKLSSEDRSTIWEYTSTTSARDFSNAFAFIDEGHVYVAGAEEILDFAEQTANTPIVLKLNGEASALM